MPINCAMLPSGLRPSSNIKHLWGIIFQSWPWHQCQYLYTLIGSGIHNIAWPSQQQLSACCECWPHPDCFTSSHLCVASNNVYCLDRGLKYHTLHGSLPWIICIMLHWRPSGDENVEDHIIEYYLLTAESEVVICVYVDMISMWISSSNCLCFNNNEPYLILPCVFQAFVVVVVIAKPARAVASLHGDHVQRQSFRGLQEGCYRCPCGSGRTTCSGAGQEDVSTRGWVVGRASDRCDVAVPCALGPLCQVWRYGRRRRCRDEKWCLRLTEGWWLRRSGRSEQTGAIWPEEVASGTLCGMPPGFVPEASTVHVSEAYSRTEVTRAW